MKNMIPTNSGLIIQLQLLIYTICIYRLLYTTCYQLHSQLYTVVTIQTFSHIYNFITAIAIYRYYLFVISVVTSLCVCVCARVCAIMCTCVCMIDYSQLASYNMQVAIAQYSYIYSYTCNHINSNAIAIGINLPMMCYSQLYIVTRMHVWLCSWLATLHGCSYSYTVVSKKLITIS